MAASLLIKGPLAEYLVLVVYLADDRYIRVTSLAKRGFVM